MRLTAPRPPRASESQIQQAVMAHIARRKLPGVSAFHVPNGSFKSKAAAGRFRAEGLVAGVPDVVVVFGGRALFLELKRIGGRISPAQERMHEELRCAGAAVAVAYGLDEALGVLEGWGVIRPAGVAGHGTGRAPAGVLSTRGLVGDDTATGETIAGGV